VRTTAKARGPGLGQCEERFRDNKVDADLLRRLTGDDLKKLIDPVLRGWVNYFAVEHASECFGFAKDWVEKKIRRHLLRARNRQGFGWTRWRMSASLLLAIGCGCSTRSQGWPAQSHRRTSLLFRRGLFRPWVPRFRLSEQAPITMLHSFIGRGSRGV
jgi:hypothetical protein